jgi:hypothetical protein
MKLMSIKVTAFSVLLGVSAYLASHPASGQQLPNAPVTAQNFNPLQKTYSVPLLDFGPSDPETDKLRASEASAEREVAKLVADYARAEGESARAKIKSSLAAALEKEFDLQQKRRDLELSAVEARIKKVRELMQKRADARQAIVEKRADQLIREADGLGWTAPSGINLQNRFLPAGPPLAR